MKGRKPTPTYLKLLKGNPGKRSLNKHEPKPALLNKPPEPPPFLRAPCVVLRELPAQNDVPALCSSDSGPRLLFPANLLPFPAFSAATVLLRAASPC